MLAKLFNYAASFLSSPPVDNRPSVDEYIKELSSMRATLIEERSKLNYSLNNKVNARKKFSSKICHIHEKKLDKKPLSELHAKRDVVIAEIGDIENRIQILNLQIETITGKITEFHTHIANGLMTIVDKVDVDVVIKDEFNRMVSKPTQLAIDNVA